MHLLVCELHTALLLILQPFRTSQCWMMKREMNSIL